MKFVNFLKSRLFLSYSIALNLCNQTFHISHVLISQKVKGVLMWKLQHIIFIWRRRYWQIFIPLRSRKILISVKSFAFYQLSKVFRNYWFFRVIFSPRPPHWPIKIKWQYARDMHMRIWMLSSQNIFFILINQIFSVLILKRPKWNCRNFSLYSSIWNGFCNTTMYLIYSLESH